jgi:glutamate/tyrosine decarboxylase-like PLP-dependent enzyme
VPSSARDVFSAIQSSLTSSSATLERTQVSKVVKPSQRRTTSSTMNQEVHPRQAPFETFSSQSAANAAQMRKLSPRCYNHQRLQIKNISEVSRGIPALTSKDGHKDQENLSWSLSRAVSVLSSMWHEKEGGPIDSSTSIKAGASQSAEVSQLLVGHGRDINQSEPDRGERPG